MNRVDLIRKVIDFTCFIITTVIIMISILFLMGMKPYVMITGSMRPTIPVGSVCFIDTTYPFSQLEKQDIIMYKSINQNVIHRIIEKNDDSYKTKGDANSKADRIEVTQEIYLGKYNFSIPKIGFLTSKIDTSFEKGIFSISLITIYFIDYLLHYVKKRRVPRK